MLKKSIFIAHNNKSTIEELITYLKNNKHYYIDQYALNNKELHEKIKLKKYDIWIIKDTILDTGLLSLERLISTQEEKPKNIVVLMNFFSEYIISKAYDMGVDYISKADIKGKKLIDIIYHINKDINIKDKKRFDLEQEITNLLEMLGMSKRYLGYKYFSNILSLYYRDKHIKRHGMMTFYNKMGDLYNVSASSVERAMRNALKKALDQQYNYFAYQLLGYDYFIKNTPSNSMVIEACIKYLRDQNIEIINRLMWDHYDEKEQISL